MAILGHVSAEMSLRYGRLFDSTIRHEYERALDLAKTRIGTLANLNPHACAEPVRDPDWTTTPTLKIALADDATRRGWDAETERHLRLITRLNTLIDQTATRPRGM